MGSLLKLLNDFFANLQAGNLPNLGNWDYLILALLVAVEGPFATLLGAAAAAAGLMRLPWVFASAAIGNLTADLLWYFLGYTGRIRDLYRLGRHFGLRPWHLETVERRLQQHAIRILVLAKLTAGLVIPTLIAAGMARIPLRRWFPAVLASEMLWTGTLVLLGYHAASAIGRIERDLRYAAIAASVLFVLVILFLIRRFLRQRSMSEESEDSSEDSDEDEQP